MNRPSRFPQGKTSPLSAQEQMRRQNQSRLPAIQPKVAPFAENRKPPVAPPVYKPQPTPRVLQRTAAVRGQSAGAQAKPAAPPVYRPQPAPKVLQTKRAVSQPPPAGKSPDRPAAPPAYRPAAKTVQPKAASVTPPVNPARPRRAAGPTVAQPKSSPRPARRPRAGVIQPIMTVIDDMDEVLVREIEIHSKNLNQRVVYKDSEVVLRADNDTAIHLVGHGNEQFVGMYHDMGALARWLVEGCKLPKTNIRTVYLHVCDGAHHIQALARELASRMPGERITVYGVHGYRFTDDWGGVWAASNFDQSKEKAFRSEWGAFKKSEGKDKPPKMSEKEKSIWTKHGLIKTNYQYEKAEAHLDTSRTRLDGSQIPTVGDALRELSRQLS